MGILPTVAVLGEGGRKIIINQSDYSPEKHTLWEKYEKSKQAEPPIESLLETGRWVEPAGEDGSEALSMPIQPAAKDIPSMTWSKPRLQAYADEMYPGLGVDQNTQSKKEMLDLIRSQEALEAKVEADTEPDPSAAEAGPAE